MACDCRRRSLCQRLRRCGAGTWRNASRIRQQRRCGQACGPSSSVHRAPRAPTLSWSGRGVTAFNSHTGEGKCHAMKIGIGLPNQIRDVDPGVIPGWARRAETAGFSSLATIGRIAYPGVMDTVALAAAAAVTTRIGLTSTVVITTVWPPVLLAKELAGIGGVSGGRLTLGVGIGGNGQDDFVGGARPPRE